MQLRDKMHLQARPGWTFALSVGLLSITGAAACGNDAAPAAGPMGTPSNETDPTSITYRDDVEPVTSVKDAKKGVFIPPYQDCRDPLPGDNGSGPGGQVCTHVVLSGCTEPGKYFPDYASCDVVRTQRPFWDEAPASEPKKDDPRLKDEAFMRELDWVTEQIEACGCVCCHDSRTFDGRFGQWDIARGPIWLDTLADTGLALFLGLADSHVLGAYPPEENHGFDRELTGVPTTDTERMKKFLFKELERRGLTEADARAVPPFGGPIYNQAVAEPKACKPGEGITKANRVVWKGGGKARYVYVLKTGSKNPGVPPNLDTPKGTLWRLDVLASEDGLPSGLSYGTTPSGSFQALPEDTSAPELVNGKTYHLTVLADVGVPLTNCLFVYGETESAPEALPEEDTDTDTDPGKDDPGQDPDKDGGSTPAPEECTLASGDERGFGATCETDDDCTCEAGYCAVQFGQSVGYCTVTTCDKTPSVCPKDWSCMDLSVFFPSLPYICQKP